MRPATVATEQKKSSLEQEALGRSQGGFTTKVHVRVERYRRLMQVKLTTT